jgi:hypothetical protein
VRITVTVPAPKAPEYLRQIADQIDGGHTGGLEDVSTNWNTARDCYDPEES